jgi:hypothetical protein
MVDDKLKRTNCRRQAKTTNCRQEMVELTT